MEKCDPYCVNVSLITNTFFEYIFYVRSNGQIVTYFFHLVQPHVFTYNPNIIRILDGEESDIGFFGMRKNYIG